MSQILKKFIGNNQVDGDKFRLKNSESLRARNFADNGDVNILVVSSGNFVELQSNIRGLGLNLGADGALFANVFTGTVDGGTSGSDLVMASNGDVELNSRTTLNVKIAGGAFLLGKYASAPAVTGLEEGHLYYNTTDSEIKIYNGTAWESLVSVAPTVTFAKESITLAAGDITNQYVDLDAEAAANSLLVVVGGVVQWEGVDYTLSVVGGVTRVTFAGDLATGGAA